MQASSAANFFLRSLPAAAVLTAVLAAAPVVPVAAQGADDLYVVSVTPDPAAGNERNAAIRRAFTVLLTRITGLAAAAEDPRLAGLASAPAATLGALVDSYVRIADDEIRVGFRPSAVDAELTRLGLPIWGAERPLTLLWLAVELGGGERAELGAAPGQAGTGRVAGAPSNPLSAEAEARFEAIADAVLAAADRRGLPLVLPELDALDRQQVRFADVFGGFDGFVERAAERYAPDAILIGRASVTGDGAVVRWVVRRGESRQVLADTGPAAGIDWLADRIAAEFATSGGARPTWLTIRRIESWPDYGRVHEYLESLSIVEAVVPEAVAADGEVRFRIVARGDDDQLRQLLRLGGELVAVPSGPADPFAPGLGSDELVYLPAWRAGDGVTDDL